MITPCEKLYETTKDTAQKTAQLIVSSPLRRTMETMLIGLKDLKDRLDAQGQPVILLDTLQEVDRKACHTPLSPAELLRCSNDEMFSSLDFSTLSEGYASKDGIFDPVNASERAKQVRRWLRDRLEREIVVVAHHDILKHIVDGQLSDRAWENTEVRVFTFHSKDDDDASLMEIDISSLKKDDTGEPTSSEMKVQRLRHTLRRTEGRQRIHTIV
ncbi:uncharacterized protein I303_104515 [Kwoniella dejecticola CBS 10117]|uniref:Phosphoglycerate mutase n=1 Tax=Kwoniella dejecticola CBS 10117 TaxID=1296121 RepID=A0AAJ8KNS5_9TREE